MTEAQKVMQAFQGLVPGAMQVLADAVEAGDQRVALAIADRAAPPRG